MTTRKGIYIASRASLPERAAAWRELRAKGIHVTSSWIDEAGPGQTSDFGELWSRILAEVTSSAAIIVYAAKDDFPLKGTLVEAGMAIAAGVPVLVVLDGVELEPRSMRPIGSWIAHPLVTRCANIEDALALAKKIERDAMGPEMEIDWLGGNCPVQAQGTIADKHFYFRARGNHLSFEISNEKLGAAEWEYEEPYGGDVFAAGWMSEDEARAFIAKAAKLYAAAMSQTTRMAP
jgi:hypothetical protein